MSGYVDGFVLPLKKDKVEEYRRVASAADKVWMEHGALHCLECVGDDLDIAEALSFRKMVGAKEDETVVFAWITYKSREHRDEVNAKARVDPRMKELCPTVHGLFDPDRMAFGGFRSIWESGTTIAEEMENASR